LASKLVFSCPRAAEFVVAVAFTMVLVLVVAEPFEVIVVEFVVVAAAAAIDASVAFVAIVKFTKLRVVRLVIVEFEVLLVFVASLTTTVVVAFLATLVFASVKPTDVTNALKLLVVLAFVLHASLIEAAVVFVVNVAAVLVLVVFVVVLEPTMLAVMLMFDAELAFLFAGDAEVTNSLLLIDVLVFVRTLLSVVRDVEFEVVDVLAAIIDEFDCVVLLVVMPIDPVVVLALPDNVVLIFVCLGAMTTIELLVVVLVLMLHCCVLVRLDVVFVLDVVEVFLVVAFVL